MILALFWAAEVLKGLQGDVRKRLRLYLRPCGSVWACFLLAKWAAEVLEDAPSCLWRRLREVFGGVRNGNGFQTQRLRRTY